MPNPVRRSLILMLLATPLLGMTGGARAQEIIRDQSPNSAESFIRDNVDKCLAILNDKTLPDPDRRQRFRDLLLSITDMPRIATFTLGRYALNATDDELDSFKRAYAEYSVTVYQTVLDAFRDYTVKVTGSAESAAGDTIVNADILNSGCACSPAIKAAFRVRKTDDGRLMIIDFEAEGVWLALSQRSEFSSFLRQHGGNISDLISEMNQHLNGVAGARSS